MQVLSKQGSGEFLQALRAALQSLRQPSKFYAEVFVENWLWFDYNGNPKLDVSMSIQCRCK